MAQGPAVSVRILVGDCVDLLSTLPDESVHCVVTSPPYWGLRDYGVEGAIGLELTFEEHLETLVTVFREVRRVLRKDGTCWLNYGDSYAGSWGAQSRDDPSVETSALSNGQVHAAPKGTHTGSLKRVLPGLKPKDLLMMPARVAMALQADGWWLRSEIVWHKPNSMPESVRDRPTSAHEKVFLLTKSARYFYDADAVRTAAEKTSRYVKETSPQARHRANRDESQPAWNVPKDQGANLRNVWTIATHPYKEAHFATFPTKLVEPCIKAGTSEKGCCPECGTPWVRGMEVHDPDGRLGRSWHDDDPKERLAIGQRGTPRGEGRPIHRTSGWQPLCDCGAGDPAPCTVIDPFGGAGTTGLVADRLGRDAILIELSPEYAEMAERRIHGDAPLLADVAVSA